MGEGWLLRHLPPANGEEATCSRIGREGAGLTTRTEKEAIWLLKSCVKGAGIFYSANLPNTDVNALMSGKVLLSLVDMCTLGAGHFPSSPSGDIWLVRGSVKMQRKCQLG